MKTIQKSDLRHLCRHSIVLAIALAATLSAPAATNGLRQPFSVRFDNSNSIPQTIYSVSGVPLPDDQPATLANTFIQTDGRGRIEGVSVMTLEFLRGDTAVGTGEFVLDITGSISTSGRKPKVNMKLRGLGFTTDGATNTAEARMNLKFVGRLHTNDLSVVDFHGYWRGSLKQSVPAINGGNRIKYTRYDDATLLIAETDARELNVDGESLRIDDKLFAAGEAIGDVPVNGSGRVARDGDFKLDLKGMAWADGTTIRLRGTSSPGTNALFTGFIRQAKGKALGQKVVAENGILTIGLEEEPPPAE